MSAIDRMNAVEREQLAAQVVAVMDAHFQRPDADAKRHILGLAGQQIEAASLAFSSVSPEDQQDPPWTPTRV